MAKYYIQYNDLQAQAESFKNISKTLGGFEGRLNSIVNAMDGRDSSMASLKRQVQNCGKSMPEMADKMNIMEKVVKDTIAEYLFTEKDNYKLIGGIPNVIDLHNIAIGLDNVFWPNTGDMYKDYPGPLKDFGDCVNVLYDQESYRALQFGYLIKRTFKELDDLNKSKKFISSIDDLMNLFDNDDNQLMEAIKDTDIYKAMGYTNDVTKLINALNSGNYSDIGELADKYIKKAGGTIVKNTFGTAGFATNSYINLAWNFIENTLDLGNYAYVGTSNSPVVGAAQYLWHCTGETILETGAEMGYDIVEGIGGLFGYDIDKVYKDLVGVDGVEGFYKAAGQLGDELFGDYYKNSGIVEGTVNLVGDTIGWWGSTISGWFK